MTPRRRFQLADAPGHVQYTRNMVTGASTADVAIILVDARKGVIEQTRRHSYLAAILGIPHVVVAVNKMDLAGFSEARFREIEQELRETSERLELRDVRVIPMSALRGDNVVERGEAMPWYDGPTLLEHLETVEIAGDRDLDHRRFPVQWVIRPISDEHHDFRGYAGQVAGGVWRAGDDVIVLPSGRRTTVASVETADGAARLRRAGHVHHGPPRRRSRRLPRRHARRPGAGADGRARARGDRLLDGREAARAADEARDQAHDPHRPRSRRRARLVVDIHTLEDQPARRSSELNDIARVRLRLAEPLAVDPYAENRTTGAFILIDEATNDTVGAGMILSASG